MQLRGWSQADDLGAEPRAAGAQNPAPSLSRYTCTFPLGKMKKNSARTEAQVHKNSAEKTQHELRLGQEWTFP